MPRFRSVRKYIPIYVIIVCCYSFFRQKIFYNFHCFGLCCRKVVVYDADIEMRNKSQFEFRFCDTAVDHFGSIRSTSFQTFTQMGDAGRLDKY